MSFEQGVHYFQEGKWQEAEGICLEGLERDPLDANLLNLLGAVRLQEHKLEEAARYIEKAISQNPSKSAYKFNLAFAYSLIGRLDDAILLYKSVQDAESFEKAAHLFIAKNDLDQAAECFLKAIQLNPKNLSAHRDLARLYGEQKKFHDAKMWLKKAHALDPQDVHILVDLAHLESEHAQNSSTTVAYLESALKINPDLAKIFPSYYFHLRKLCAFEKADQIESKIKLEYESPFQNILRGMDPAINLQVAQKFATFLKKEKLPERPVRLKEKLTIGYLSCDFHHHATSHLILGLFEAHDKSRFAIHVYSYGHDDHSHYRKKIKKDATKFVDLSALSDEEAAACIRADEVDILVDLKGHTQGVRLGIAALKPAPIQIVYLGFPGTCGVDFYDYILTDKIVSPSEHARFYSEKLLYMPNCYQINDDRQPISPKFFTRNEFGLPAEGIVFAAFNMPAKIEKCIFDVWMRLLKRIPGSVLWMHVENKEAQKNLQQAAGPFAERLIFAPPLPKDEHLARLKLAGFALDTRTYNGHTTTSDALWAGLPVVTIMGGHFASRVSASLLTHIGLPELITHSLQAYEALAFHLATHPDELQNLKKKLEQNRATYPLFDTKRFVSDLEKAYQAIWLEKSEKASQDA